MADGNERQDRANYRLSSVILFFLLHASCLAVFFVPFRWSWVALAAGLYFVRMFGVTAGYHRYFSHRTYKLARVPQFLLAFLAETSGQKGVLWWAAHHREHHCILRCSAAFGGRTWDGFCQMTTTRTIPT